MSKIIPLARRIAWIIGPVAAMSALCMNMAYAAPGLISDISYARNLLAQIGPMISAMLFVIAGIFYAIGQILPPEKRASFHTTAINIIIGAVVVGALSVASEQLAVASTHIISNVTKNMTANASI